MNFLKLLPKEKQISKDPAMAQTAVLPATPTYTTYITHTVCFLLFTSDSYAETCGPGFVSLNTRQGSLGPISIPATASCVLTRQTLSHTDNGEKKNAQFQTWK